MSNNTTTTGTQSQQLVNHLLQSLKKDSFADEATGVEFSITTDEGYLVDIFNLSNLVERLSVSLQERTLKDCNLVIIPGYDDLFDMKKRVAVSVCYTY